MAKQYVVVVSGWDYDLSHESIILWDGETDITNEVREAFITVSKDVFLRHWEDDEEELKTFDQVKDVIMSSLKKAAEENVRYWIPVEEIEEGYEIQRVFIGVKEISMNTIFNVSYLGASNGVLEMKKGN